MKALLASLLFAQSALAQAPPGLPAWLVPYPGASADRRASAVLVESAYRTPAAPSDVVAHYEKLFAATGLPFHPSLDGIGTVLRAAPPECDLLIQIRGQEAGSLVRVSCSVKTPELTESRPRPAARIQQDSQNVRDARWEAGRQGNQRMEKFDRPVYPSAKPPLPPLAWPDWLVSCDGAPLQIGKGVDQFKLSYLKTTFTSMQDRATIQAFYAGLLNANGYAVEFQSSRITPAGARVQVQGTYYPGEKPGPRLTIRAEITPVDVTQQVELRITRRP